MAKKTARGIMNTVQSAAALTVGAAVASKVSNINLPVPAPVKPLLPIILGAFLMKKGGFMGNVGAGMVAAGGVKAVAALAPGLGIGAGELIGDYAVIEGAEDYALAGTESGGETISAPASYALAGDDTLNSDMFG